MAQRDRRGGWNWRLWAGLLGVVVVVGLGVASLFYLPFPLAYPAPEQQFLLPSLPHWLGTDGAGRDLASLLMASLFTSLAVAGAGTLIGLVLGVPIGFAAMAKPRLLGWIAEGAGGLLLVLSPLAVAIVGAAIFGPHATIAAVAIGLAGFGQTARLMHRHGTAMRQRGFIVAARLGGLGDGAIAARHVLPNIAPAIIVAAIGQLGAAVLWEALLSFLGFGVAAPRTSFGLMLADAQAAVPEHAWEAALTGVVITLVVLSFRLLADGIGRALAPAAPSGSVRLAAA